MINGIKPLPPKEDFEVAVDKLLENIHLDYVNWCGGKNSAYTIEPEKITLNPCRKYIKVKYFTTNNGKEDSGRIHCFVDSTNGDIYKAATWRAPYTKGNNAVRGSIYDESCFEKTDLYGSWLYAK